MSTQWADERTAFTRAFAGAAIFGIPLIFTMEMWWIGKSLSFQHLLLVFALGFIGNLGLAHVAGFREESTLLISLDQAIDAMAVGLVGSGLVLFAMNQLRITDGINQAVDTIILLSIPLSLGASVARQVFSGRTRQGDDEEDVDSDDALSVWQGLLSDIMATAIGGVFIGISIAPTDEVWTVSTGLTDWHVYMMIGMSLLLSYLIVFASGFDEKSPPGPFHHPISETMLAYVISLVVAFMMLDLLDRVSFDDPLSQLFRETVVLALPVTIGGAAGRLVV